MVQPNYESPGFDEQVAAIRAGDSADLGMVLSPLEAALDLTNENVVVEFDTEPFDEAAERARAEQIAHLEVLKEYAFWDFAEPPFVKIPSAERAQFWRDYLAEVEAPHRARNKYLRVELPWAVAGALATNPGAPASQLITEPVGYGLLALRPALRNRPAPELAAARATLKPPFKIDTSRVQAPGAEVAAAVLGGFETEVSTALQQAYRYWPWLPIPVAPALLSVDPNKFEQEAAACSPMTAVPWLVRFGADGFAEFFGIAEITDRNTAMVTLRQAARILHGPGAVPLFADSLATKSGEVAADWFRKHPALILAVDQPDVEAMVPFLRELPVEMLRRNLPQTAPRVVPVVEQVLAEAAVGALDDGTDWWQAAANQKQGRTKKLPAWLNPAALPPLLVGDQRLSQMQLRKLLLAASTGNRDQPLVTAVRDQALVASRDEFAIELVELWLAFGAPPTDHWLLSAAATLGEDRFVHYLTPLVRQWPTDRQFGRAKRGVAALRVLGSQSALAAIAGIATKVKSVPLKKYANQVMTQVAEEKGWTRDELADRIVTTAGLAMDGTRVFGYGSRAFQARLTSEGKIEVRELAEGRPTGKAMTALPAARIADDAQLAATARDEFKLLKKTITGLVKSQRARFERAMVTGREWTREEFEQLIVTHPVLRVLASGLVWGSYDGAGALIATARLDEGGKLVDDHDEPVNLASDLKLRIVHPVELTDETRRRWIETMLDYELGAAFPQLERASFRLDASQQETTRLPGPADEVFIRKLLSSLEKQGWERVLIDGNLWAHSQTLGRHNLTAVLCHDELWLGDLSGNTRVQGTILLAGAVQPEGIALGEIEAGRYVVGNESWEMLPWGEAPAPWASEVLWLLQNI